MIKINNFKGDLFGGITAGIVALPLALAFGVQSGMGASAGLYGAMALGLFAAIFGGTKTQISGPTGPMTVVSATIVSSAIAKYGSIDSALGLILITFALSGAFQILFGFLKIGKYIKFIPYPVLSGFMSGIGVIIIIFQIFPVMGLNSPSKIISVFTELPDAISQVNFTSIIIALITVVVIYVFPRLTKVVPGTLVALIGVSGVCYFLQCDTPLIGAMPSGLPALKVGSIINIEWSDLSLALMPAITLAGLGTIDSLLTSVVADNVTRTRHNSNKELIGQGIGNIVASLIGGIPGAGATMRTVVNINSGGHSRISGIIHALLLVLILLGLGQLVAYIPLAALAGVLITVGISILDMKGLKNILNVSRSDAVILIVVLILTVFVDLLQAVGIGMVLASLVFMRKASESAEANTSLQRVAEGDTELAWEDEMKLNMDKYQHVYIKHIEGPVFFGIASKIMERVNLIPEDAKVVIFRLQRVPFIDQSGLYALEEVIREMQLQGITVVLSRPQKQPLYLLKKNGFIPGIIPEDHVFEELEDCAKWLRKREN
ncbi:SulP family inorganic anion transporter [Puteibacter caeruleilacunae]|nr:SulP family inorganic anion transporter [Puteibacter caeruleilacunae]